MLHSFPVGFPKEQTESGTSCTGRVFSKDFSNIFRLGNMIHLKDVDASFFNLAPYIHTDYKCND